MSKRWILIALVALVLIPPATGEQDAASLKVLKPMLKKGDLVLIESKDGKPHASTAHTLVDAPIDVVWNTILDYPSYPTFMPRCISAKPTRPEPGILHVAYEIDVPMSTNYRYVIRFAMDRKNHVLDGRWHSGDLKGGLWHWKLHAMGEQTLIVYRAYSPGAANNRLLRAFDDKYKSMAYAVNVASSHVVVKAMRHEVERRAREAEKKAKKKTF